MSDENHSQMLGRIAAYVEEFAKLEDDTTFLCVLRLLAEYHELKADELHRAVEREEGKNK